MASLKQKKSKYFFAEDNAELIIVSTGGMLTVWQELGSMVFMYFSVIFTAVLQRAHVTVMFPVFEVRKQG